MFRLFLADFREMVLTFAPEADLLSLAFAVYVAGMLFLQEDRSVRRTNINDIVQESHTSEPVREDKEWARSRGHRPGGGSDALLLHPDVPLACPVHCRCALLSAGPHRYLSDAAPHGGEQLAEIYGVDITTWQEVGAATLAGNGTVSIEQDNGALGTTYTVECREIQSGAAFFSESAWNALTGQSIDLAPAPAPR